MSYCGVLQLDFLTEADLSATPCCYGSAEDGPEACTCWDPVYDVEQEPPLTELAPVTRRRMCTDCAFRLDSPERARGEEPEALPNFYCHQGIRRPSAWRHPDGRVRPAVSTADYRPLIYAARPYQADGTPAARCAGWEAMHW